MEDESFMDSDEMLDENEEDVVSLLRKVQQQIAVLEKKVDMLLARSKERSFGENAPNDRSFRKPRHSNSFRSFDRPERQDRGERDRSFREKDAFPSRYGRHRVEKKKGGNSRKKPFFFQRKDKD